MSETAEIETTGLSLSEAARFAKEAPTCFRMNPAPVAGTCLRFSTP